MQNPLKYLTKANKEIILFDLVHETQITKYIERLLNKRSTGLDNISSILIKILCYTFRIPLTIINNELLITANFPDMCKIAKVMALHKGGESVNDNYTPIFLSPVLFKF